MAENAMRVLIVEDEALLAMDLENTLRRQGHAVLGPFGTSEDALSALSEELPDAALLDVNLGQGTNSLEVARRLQEASVPFAFLTGYAASATMIGREYPNAERLPKPCSPSQLAEAIGRLTG